MWMYKGNEVNKLDPEVVGFVYLITNMKNGRMYVGKKLAQFKRTKTRVVKLKSGEKRKKKIRDSIESDWKTYFGSSTELCKDVEEQGEENFKREILYYCTSKAECSYLEAREQFTRNVLLDDRYYNGNIMCKIHKSHVKGKLQCLI